MTVHLRTGDMDRRVTIQQHSTTVDTFGQASTAWTDVLSCWAKVEQLEGRELLAAQAINSETTHVVTVLYRPGITAAMRVVYQGRKFNVQSVIDPETAHVVLQLQCSEGMNPG